MASIATYVEFIKYENFASWSYWAGLLPVLIFSIPFVIIRFEIIKRLKKKIKGENKEVIK